MVIFVCIVYNLYTLYITLLRLPGTRLKEGQQWDVEPQDSK
jgi:hypothetical protein